MHKGLGSLPPPPGSPPKFQLSEDNDRSSGQRGQNKWHNNVHPKILELTKTVRETRTDIPLNNTLKKAGMKMKDLPSIKCDTEKGRQKVCWKYILGNCPSGPNCGFAHVPQSKISDEYLDKFLPSLTKVITEGVEKLPEESTPRNKASKRKRQGGTFQLTMQEE